MIHQKASCFVTSSKVSKSPLLEGEFVLDSFFSSCIFCTPTANHLYCGAALNSQSVNDFPGIKNGGFLTRLDQIPSHSFCQQRTNSNSP
ncbi:hypothetical protein T11_14488 [Trichinella zimbabwensis]|uniref:Uncharacterized protein n=1 Tax=Trichinella zimbabwensis TaxID=268475 RepID=A0A0V1HPX7_9BILA|nr:hypothetical protein T11_14488 [Trichinella zimbabwensis]